MVDVAGWWVLVGVGGWWWVLALGGGGCWQVVVHVDRWWWVLAVGVDGCWRVMVVGVAGARKPRLDRIQSSLDMRLSNLINFFHKRHD